MKPIASSMQHADTLPGKSVDFGIGDPRWVMQTLADLYSNRELATIREYSTNARDANDEAGNSDPIRVTLPSLLNNNIFIVEDKGIGMTEKTLNEVYTQFGISSKRDSNDFNGMLGFGCKAAVAYTHTFTVTTVKDGIMTVGVVTRKPDFSIQMKIPVYDQRTSEPNGTRIEIPVHNSDKFNTIARDFFRFWKPGTVLVNSKEPAQAVGEKINDNLYYSKDQTSYVVMGGVAYPLANPYALFPAGMNRWNFVAYVNNGDVEFTPNREALKYSEHTNKNLKKIITDFCTDAVENAKAEVAAAKTAHEAYGIWDRWVGILGVNQLPELKFKGQALGMYYKVDGWRYEYRAQRYNTDRINEDLVRRSLNTIYITGFDPTDFNASHKAKIKAWLSHKSLYADNTHVIVTRDKKLASMWIAPDRVVMWETVKAEAPKPVRKPRTATANANWGRKAGSFDLITKDGYKKEQDVPNSKELYFIYVKDNNNRRGNLQQILSDFNLDWQVVVMPLNRVGKFMRHYGHAKNVMSVLPGMLKTDGVELLSDDAKVFLSTSYADRQAIVKLKPKKIDDPEIARYQQIFAVSENAYTAAYDKHEYLAYFLGQHSTFKRHPWVYYNSSVKCPLFKDYPLLTAMDKIRPEDIEHMYVYLNAVYAARKEGLSV